MSYEVQRTRWPLFKWRGSDPLQMGLPGSSRSGSHAMARAWRLINLAGPFLGLLLVVGLFSLSPSVRPYFLTGPNFKIILTQTVIVAMGALGMTLIIVSGGIDLSVGSVVALTSVVGAELLAAGLWASAVIGYYLVAGAGVGLVTGVTVAGFRLMPFIVPLGMMGTARGAATCLYGNLAVD